MDPTLVVILISAVVLVFPMLKGIWTRLNGPESPKAIFPAQGDASTPPVQTAAKPVDGCLSKLVAFASCLPEKDRKELIQRFAADLVMKEIQ